MYVALLQFVSYWNSKPEIMKHKFTILITACVAVSLFSCKKESVRNNYGLNGKWQETKLRLYSTSNGNIVYDTTYQNPFTNLDYVQFAGDSCKISTDHYYYLNSPGEPKTPQLIPQSIVELKFTVIGNGKFVLDTQPEFLNPGGFSSTDTLTEINSSMILIHGTYYSFTGAALSVSDAYYQK